MGTVNLLSNGATISQIETHLTRCSMDFFPPLHERVDIAAYAVKLHSSSRRFEAWRARSLVGLVAAYFNDVDGSVFVSSVSVLSECRGQGLASRLLREAVGEAVVGGFHSVSLEVSDGHRRAIGMYGAAGFTVTHRSPGTIGMTFRIMRENGMNAR